MALRAMLIDFERLSPGAVVTAMRAVFRRLRLISFSQAKSLRHPAFRIVAPTSRAFSTCFGSFVMARISAFAARSAHAVLVPDFAKSPALDCCSRCLVVIISVVTGGDSIRHWGFAGPNTPFRTTG